MCYLYFDTINQSLITPYGLSNLLLSLQGEELHIHKLELSLSIYSPEERYKAIQKFIECVSTIFEILSLQIPSQIFDSISRGENYTYGNDDYSVGLTLEVNERVENMTLLITSA